MSFAASAARKSKARSAIKPATTTADSRQTRALFRRRHAFDQRPQYDSVAIHGENRFLFRLLSMAARMSRQAAPFLTGRDGHVAGFLALGRGDRVRGRDRPASDRGRGEIIAILRPGAICPMRLMGFLSFSCLKKS